MRKSRYVAHRVLTWHHHVEAKYNNADNLDKQMETINKLLKKQAPKTSKKRSGSVDLDVGPPPTLIRWVSNKNGSKVSVPNEVMAGPVGEIFGPPGQGSNLNGSKLVQEVA